MQNEQSNHIIISGVSAAHSVLSNSVQLNPNDQFGNQLNQPVQNNQNINIFQMIPVQQIQSRQLDEHQDNNQVVQSQNINIQQMNPVLNQQSFTSKKKRNFKKLLEDHSQIPDDQYYPNENHFELRQQFKKMKLSQDAVFRQEVQLGEIQNLASQNLQIQNQDQGSARVSAARNELNQIQILNNQIHNSDNHVEQINAVQDVIIVNSPEQIELESLQSIIVKSQFIPNEIVNEEFRPAGSSLIEEVENDRNQQQELQIENNVQSTSRKSKRLDSQRSRGISLVDAEIDDYKDIRELNFSKFIVPKLKMIQSIQQKREKFHQKMVENPSYIILKQQNPKIVEMPIKDLHKLLKQRSQVQFAMKVRIIELRFGKYGNLKPIIMSITNIAKRVSIARSTVYKIIQKYVESDGMISAQPEKQQRKKIIESTVAVGENLKSITEILKDPKILRQWAHLSLDARCGILKSTYGISMSRYTLANCYKELNIGYLKIHSSFYSARSEEEMVRLRVNYITKIFKYMMQGREIVYMDETSTDCWATRTKIWQPKDSVLPLVVQRTQQKEKNITIIGAISVQNDNLFSLVTYSTTIDTVQDFYKRYKWSEELEDKVVVMDNHRAHWSEQIRDFLEKNQATPVYLPPCSSYFNPIETIWSWVKAKWRNSILQLPDLNQNHTEWMKEELAMICQSCPKQVIQNILRSSTGLMIKYMNQYAPDSEELENFEKWWKEQYQEAFRRQEQEANQSQEQEANQSQIVNEQ